MTAKVFDYADFARHQISVGRIPVSSIGVGTLGDRLSANTFTTREVDKQIDKGVMKYDITRNQSKTLLYFLNSVETETMDKLTFEELMQVVRIANDIISKILVESESASR
ncbi:MAG: hypothetical protein Q7S34_00695 [bacterium]|nr:hypothetical protein [bacterium]